MLTQAVIMAGGKGTRLLSLTNDEIPKPMIPVNGKPILQWQIDCLRREGITNIAIVTGHLGHKIGDFFGDGNGFGVSITYYHEELPLGTAGSLGELADNLEDDFFLVFGDAIFDIALDRMAAFHREKGASATLFVHPNSHPFDSDMVLRDENSRITGFLSKKSKRTGWYDNCVNAGFYILNRELCRAVPRGKKADLEKDILFPLAAEGKAVYAYASTEYIKDVGTPERIRTAGEELEKGVVAARNLRLPQRCVFLDRDGTLNRHRGLIAAPEELELEEYVAEAIQKLNRSGWLAIVVTNQPVVARGMCSLHDIECIHNKLKTLLGSYGAYVDDIFFCPHHPDKGYPEENPIYKIHCDCRKPAAGMLYQAAQRYHIDLQASWMIGDTTVDIKTGLNAGLHTALLMTGEKGADRKYEVIPEFTGETLLAAVDHILKEDEKHGLPL